MGAGFALLMMVGLSAPTEGMLDARALQDSAAVVPDTSVLSTPIPSGGRTHGGGAGSDSSAVPKSPKRRSVGARATHMVKSFASDLGYMVT